MSPLTDPFKTRTPPPWVEGRQHRLATRRSPEQEGLDAKTLASFGYVQELNRSLGFFSNFAIAFSFTSATAALYGLFTYGLQTGGPAMIWSWPVVVFGQLMVAFTFAEAASHFPLAGGVYQYAKRLVNGTWGWFAAWMLAAAWMLTAAGVARAAAPIVCSALGIDDPSPRLLLLIAVVFALTPMLLNMYGIRITAFFNNIGTLTEIIGVVVIAIALYVVVFAGDGPHQSWSVLVDTANVGAGRAWGYGGAFLAAMMTSAWVLYGFDSAGDLAEETANPTRTVPRAMIMAVVITAVVVTLWLVAMMLAIPDVGQAMKSQDAIAYIFEAHFPPWIIRLFLATVCIAMFVCNLAVQAGATRLVFAYGRDRMIPAAELFGAVNSRTKTPIAAALFVGVGTVGIAAAQSTVAHLVAWAIAITYIAYQMVVFGSILARTRGWPRQRAAFSLGRWGWPVNLLAFAYGMFMIVNLSWPRGIPGGSWFDAARVPVSVGIVIALGALTHLILRARGFHPEGARDVPGSEAGGGSVAVEIDFEPRLAAAVAAPLLSGATRVAKLAERERLDAELRELTLQLATVADDGLLTALMNKTADALQADSWTLWSREGDQLAPRTRRPDGRGGGALPLALLYSDGPSLPPPIVTVEDGLAAPRLNPAWRPDPASVSLLVAPLVLGGQPVGALRLSYNARPHRFTPEEIDFVSKAAAIITGALHSTRQTERLRELTARQPVDPR